jgi:hypothetical protein
MEPKSFEEFKWDLEEDENIPLLEDESSLVSLLFELDDTTIGYHC